MQHAKILIHKGHSMQNAMQLSINISCLQGAQQQIHCCCCQLMGQTDRCQTVT